jgi:hypothetical protein
MVPHPACVTQVGDLDGNNTSVNLLFERLCGTLVERDTRHFSLQEITA